MIGDGKYHHEGDSSMVFGDCPHCSAPFTTVVPDADLPMAEKITCEACGEWFWEIHSRIEPRAYLPDEVEVDEETHSIRILGGEAP